MEIVEEKCIKYKIWTISEIKSNNSKFDISQNLRLKIIVLTIYIKLYK